LDPECKSERKSLNHAVLVVGCGVENGSEYWLIKNSWGTSWGDKGYFKLAKNKRNACGKFKKSLLHFYLRNIYLIVLCLRYCNVSYNTHIINWFKR